MALLFASWWLELAAVVVTLLAGIYLYVTNVSYQYWRKRGLPNLEPSFPFGNIKDMVLQRATMAQTFQEIYKKLSDKKIAGIYQFWKPSVVLLDPEMVKHFLVKDFGHFHDHGLYVDVETDPLAGHLFNLEGTKWKQLRNKLTPTFTSGKLKMMFPTLVKCSKELHEYLDEKADKNISLEVKDVLAKYSTDVIATVAFGIQSNSLKNPDSEFRRMGYKIFEPSYRNNLRDTLAVMVPSVAAIIKIPTVPKALTEFFVGAVKETIAFREKNNVVMNDFMQLLIRIKNKKSIVDEADKEELLQTMGEKVDKEVNYYDVNGMTIEEVAAQAFVFFGAGFETSSSTMSFCLHELALNKDVQDRLRDELDSAVADNGGEMTYEAIMKMPYLDKVISETLRKYPPVPALLRVCNKEYKVPGTDVLIEKGTTVFIPVQALHWDARHYPDPETFDPERFSEEAKAKRHHYAYLPFGEGPRICIGNRFGLMQTKVGLAALLIKYQFDVCPITTRVPLVMDPKAFIATPIGGFNLKISRRNVF